MRRDFGSHLPRILGRPLNESTITAIYAAANEAIATWEPRVEVVATQIDLGASESGHREFTGDFYTTRGDSRR